MYWDYKKYARDAIKKHFSEIEQEDVKNKYTELLYKVDYAIRDITQKIFEESAQCCLRDVWAKTSHAIHDDLCTSTNLKNCEYLSKHEINNIMNCLYKNNKEDIYNHVLAEKDENIKDLRGQLKHVEAENEKLKEQIYGK